MADKDALDRTRTEQERDALRAALRDAKPALLRAAECMNYWENEMRRNAEKAAVTSSEDCEESWWQKRDIARSDAATLRALAKIEVSDG